MHRLYLDTCILNDFFALIRRESGEEVRPIDVKTPPSRWTAEYVALYHLLDLDDQWELEFGTSEVALQEIARFSPQGQIACEKKSFLEQVYEELAHKCKPELGPASARLVQRVNELLGPGYDSLHLCRAIQGGWEFFITTDFRTILDKQDAVRELDELIIRRHGYQGKLWPQDSSEPVVEKFGIKARSPLQFLEENLLPLPTLIRTLHGSWSNPEEFINRFGQTLLELSRPRQAQ